MHPTLRPLRAGLRLVQRRLEDFHVRAAVLTHGERAIVFDTLAHPADMGPITEMVEGCTVEVVYSHADWDHCWGTSGLGDVAAVVAHTRAAARFHREVPRELAAKRESEPEYEAVMLVPPDVTFQRRLDLFLDGVLVELHALPGHTADSIVAFVPSWGVLLAGDAVETPVPVVNEAAAVGPWVERLQAWSDDPRVATVVPSHGEVGGRELLSGNAEYLRGLMEGRREAPAASGILEPFYRETHARNIALLGG